MPYATGEAPTLGDKVMIGKRPGTVVDVITLPGPNGDEDFVSVQWPDGERDAAALNAEGYVLVSRKK